MLHVSLPVKLPIFSLNIFLSFDGKSYQAAGSSAESHRYTYGMANYLGKALTTGCYSTLFCSVKTELMDMKTLTWSSGPDFPFTGPYELV